MDKSVKNYTEFINESVIQGKPVVRYAPSPTGASHLAGIRTALYNYFIAKKYNGKFILRIEDTDSQRFVPGAEQYIIDTFKWLNIDFDEGPHIGGPNGPYRQSERRDIYIKYVNQLINDEKAYYAFDTPEELDKIRGQNEYFSYDAKIRMSLKNSLTIPMDKVKEMIKDGVPYVVRIKYPEQPITITLTDIVCGNVSVNSATLDDKVLWKSVDTLPTYHLANIVDDHLMGVTLVCRGNEWLPSAPMHVFLYDCFGWKRPQFAHLPLVLKPEGNGKLSKRDGDLGGFSVFPLPWTDPKDSSKSTIGSKGEGYLPSAVINFLAFLGWNPGTEKEFFTLDELIQDFSLERVGKAGARFNPVKAIWFNGQHLKNIDTRYLFDDFKKDLEDRGIHRDDTFIYKVLDANKGKVNFIKDIYNEASYLFKKPTEFDQKVIKKLTFESLASLKNLAGNFEKLHNWFSQDIQKVFESFVSDNKIEFSNIAPQLRLLLTGKANGPSLFDIMEMIGKDETIDRLTNHEFKVEAVKDVVKEKPSNDDQEKFKIKKEIEGLNKLLIGITAKLDNKNFTERAPKNIVEMEQKKKDEYIVKIAELEKQLN
jgi:glutamyl-tRNA synthetase